MTEEAIRFDRVSHSYGTSRVLCDLSFCITAGTFVAIVGRNGSGKSTLLKRVAGLLSSGRSEGVVHLIGKPLSGCSRREIAKAVAYVPQSVSGPMPFSVLEYVRLSRYPHASLFGPSDGDDAAVISALSTMDMLHAARRSMDTLSGGECQKVVTAAALAQETPILLLDEPSAFLDHRHAGEIGRTLKRVHREKGRTVVMVTHDINRAACLGDRIIALKNGAQVFDGSPVDFMNEEVLYEVLEERFVQAPHPLGGLPVAVPRARL